MSPPNIPSPTPPNLQPVGMPPHFNHRAHTTENFLVTSENWGAAYLGSRLTWSKSNISVFSVENNSRLLSLEQSVTLNGLCL